MRLERLAGEVDFDGFRAAARRLWMEGAAPDDVQWVVDGSAAQPLPVADAAGAAPAETRPAPRVPADFVELCGSVVLHRDLQRFHLLYRLLWRLQTEPGLREDRLDPEMSQARLMAQAVRRDIHKMRAFVRFREIPDDGPDGLHVAWFEPEHHIVEANAPFFMRRFTGMRWAILTPERSVSWDGAALAFGPGASKQDAPSADAGESLWLTYYRSIFNPARLKLRAMEKEMPRKYWHNLPEAALITELADQAQARSGAMVEAAATVPARRLPPAPAMPRAKSAIPIRADGAADAARGVAWTAERDAAMTCRECPLGALATQTVWGEGPLTAKLMFVGEQPGDKEDIVGRPFVGPAGQLLDRALQELNWERSVAYVTNAVKHFKYEPRGKRRIHKTPAQKEADACEHWLESEIAIVQPKAIIALGSTAARQVLKRPVGVLRERGHWLKRADGLPVLVTLHPSALLRADAPDREAGYAAWLKDLSLATPYAVAA